MVSIKLYYFNFWGRGELSRLLLAASGREWDDVRFDREEWHNTDKFKPNAPYGQAPYLEYDKKFYGQSVAIANFLARELGFVGGTNIEALRNDEVVQLVQEMMRLLVEIYYEEDEVKKGELVEKFKSEKVPHYYTIFQRLLTETSHPGHFVGNKLSMADLAVYDMVTNTQAWFKTAFDDDYPAVKILRAKVETNVSLKKYLDRQKAASA